MQSTSPQQAADTLWQAAQQREYGQESTHGAAEAAKDPISRSSDEDAALDQAQKDAASEAARTASSKGGRDDSAGRLGLRVSSRSVGHG